MHHVIILDPGIASRQLNEKMYTPLIDGLRDDIFVKNSTGQPLEGKVFNLNGLIRIFLSIYSNYIQKVWNNGGGTAFIDFTHPKAAEYWETQISNFLKVVNFDGLWLVSI